ncbi:xin actin-binding repeat-containing protein 1-like isoform X2 [Xiphophorus maculatus]|nr:xin actin-binding repeat-containing protein 1-like isoform X2 [Xiphophorus maculatus]XP_023182221.1 xin actin-binding repeat-containing protein 1-like isoform X2 [Xiphophorus maculatus]XP_023182222.1 xin actin-binding repeat-containing protein 1-like isoform X2 [Xiphophorus maculatus]
MEREKDLRRSQSLKSLPSQSDKAIWTDAGLQDRTISVSQLVARYQTTVKKRTSSQPAPENNVEGNAKKPLMEMTPSPLNSRETHLESLLKRNEERERVRATATLTRSKSVGSLQNSTGSIEALKALFELKTTAKLKPKSSFRTGNVALGYAVDEPVMNGETEDVQSATEEQKKPAEKKTKKEPKDDFLTQKVVNQTQTERNKTIAGIDFEKLAASEADEKRRSAADFRDSSFIQTTEIPSVSVKAMSALYMSKVANKESPDRPSKVEKDQAQPRDLGKWTTLTKMDEDSEQRKDDYPPQPPEEPEKGLEDIADGHSEQLMSSQLAREKLFQQRQKNELRRLLKHTCPEIKMLDDVVNEEFAEVLSSKSESGGETGYEGEVLSRCLIFENRGSSYSSPKTCVEEGAVERQDYRKISAVLEGLKDEPCTKSCEGMMISDKSPDLTLNYNKEVEEQITKIDVKATRKVFENKCSSTVKPDENQRNVTMVLNKPSEISSADSIQGDNKSGDKNLEEQKLCASAVGKSTEYDISCREAFPCNDFPLEGSFISCTESERKREIIKTNAALFQNNPFISFNIERENFLSHPSKTQNQSIVASEDYPIANVKNRTHLFESMPFDKIRHQNQDEIETLVENIKETLNFLYHVKAIHSDGVIIEVNETMIAKKAQFLISGRGPEIKYDKVAEGGAQNFIVQLLPRVNLKPQIIYLKEDNKGFMEATVVDALAHQHRFSANKDAELKTANVVQLVEDILIQDNSLRKGVIIQEDARNGAKVIVYSLYKYFDEEDVKSYSPPNSADHDEPEAETVPVSKSIQDQSRSGSIRANVKLFKTCIEKGDLGYLRSLHDDEQTIHNTEHSQSEVAVRLDDESHHHHISNPTEECIQVDVKKLKGMFSEGTSPNRSKCVKSSAVTSGKSQSPIECNTGAFLFPQSNNSFNACFGQGLKEVLANSEHQNQNRVQQGKMAEAYTEELCEIPTVTLSGAEAESAQEISSTKVESCLEKSNKSPLVEGIFSAPESDWLPKNTETVSEEASSKNEHTSETCNKINEGFRELAKNENVKISLVPEQISEAKPEQQEEVCCQGTIQAALDSLEKSNINVTRGDIRAAMIYRQSNKSYQKNSQSYVQKHSTTDFCFLAEPKSNQEQQKPETPNQEVTVANVEPPHLTTANTEPLHLTKDPLHLPMTASNAEPSHPSVSPLNLKVTLLDAEPPHPTKEPLNVDVNVMNAEPPHPAREALKQKVIVTNLEPLHPAEGLMDIQVTVSNAEPPCPTTEPLNQEVTVANVEPSHPTKELLNLEVTLSEAEFPHPTKETLNLKETVVNAEYPHPSKELLNQEMTVANVEPPCPTKMLLNQEATVAHVEPSHPPKEPLNLEVAVPDAEPPHPPKKPLNHEAAMANLKPLHPTEDPVKLQVNVANAEPPCLTKGLLNQDVNVANAEPPHPIKTHNRPSQGVVSTKSKRITGPKPPIPPKPEHLKEKQEVSQPSASRHPEEHKISTMGTEEMFCQVSQPSVTTLFLGQEDTTNKSVDHHENYNLDKSTKMLQQIKGKSDIQCLTMLLESNETDIRKINEQQKIETIEKKDMSESAFVHDIISETDETHINFHEARQKFTGKVVSSKKTAPVKPKRVKHVQSCDKTQKHLTGECTTDGTVHIGADPSSSNCEITADSADRHYKDAKQDIKVEMREKKARMETDDERRQRLSIHMDEIVRGNVTAAMEIFEHLRKQEQLQSILSRVEEIESDTSEVDVTSLRRVFENFPDWIVNTDKTGRKKVKAENKDKVIQSSADKKHCKSSMEHVYGDLERASEEIINLKEQTLARLKDIEDTIKKALLSVSSLKSDSDIANLSNLLKESLGVVQESPHSSKISKTDLSRTKPQQSEESYFPQRSSSTGTAAAPTTDQFSTKQQQSPPSSPAFISIQSAARKTDKTDAVPPETLICMKCQLSPRPEGKFRTTKTVMCNSPTQGKKVKPKKGEGQQTSNSQQNRELSVLQVQTDSEGNSIRGTAVENYERTDDSDNRS